MSQKGERVEESDLYGLSLIEIVYRGMQMTIDTTCKLYNTVARDALFPFGGAFGTTFTAANPIAKLGTALNHSLVLTAVANTSAAASPATLTAKSVLSPDNNSQIIFNSVHREVPLRWDVLTTESGGTGSLFTVT